MMTEQLHDVNHVSDSSVEAKATAPQPIPIPVAPRPEVQVDDSGAAVCYANFCRVTGTPEELILDFGLNAQPMGAATNVEIKQRLVMNYFTAKRLLQALGMSVQRHEGAFGVLETDVQKRVTPSLRRAAVSG
jgi:hypothetical protein